VKLSGIISEANDVAEKYNLQLVEIDSTDNIISLKLLTMTYLSKYMEIHKRTSSILPLLSSP